MFRNLKNKRGFTLIEIIAVVVILVLLVGLTIPVISKYLNEGKDNYNRELENEFLTIVQNYYAENPEKKPSNVGVSAVWLPNLNAQNYLNEELLDADGGSCYDSVGYAKYNGKDIEYYACLKCENYNTGYEGCVGKGSAIECETDSGEKMEILETKFYEASSDTAWAEKKLSSDESYSTNKNFKIVFIANEEGTLYFKDKTYHSEYVNEEGNIYYTFTILLEKDYKISKDDLVIATDRCFNSSSMTIGKNIIIDKKKPTITINGGEKYVIKYNDSDNKEEIKNTIKVIDEGSGFKKLKYRFDEDAYTELTDSNEQVSKNVGSGTYTLEVVATDKAGNESRTVKSFDVDNQIKLVSDGKEINVIEKAFNDTVKFPKVSKAGYSLKGWKSSVDGKIYKSKYSENISATLTAQWEEITPEVVDKYVTIDFYCSGSSKVSESGQYRIGDNLYGGCSKTGYNQDGWSLKLDGTSNYDIEEDIDKEMFEDLLAKEQPIKLYAVWNPKKVYVVYDCDKDGKKDSDETKVTFTYDKAGEHLDSSKCSQKGYVLKDKDAWHRDKIGDNPANDYDPTWTVTNDFKKEFAGKTIFLKPNREKKKVTIHYDCDDDGKKDTKEKTVTVAYGDTVKLSKDACSLTGYVLKKKGWRRVKLNGVDQHDYELGWTVSKDFVDTFYGIKNKAGKVMVSLTPNYSPIEVTVHYDCDKDGKKDSKESKVTYTYDKEKQKLKKDACSKSGLVLQGWSKTKSCNIDFKPDYAITNKWIKKYSDSLRLYPVYESICDTTDECKTDKVAPSCQLVTSCYSVSKGVRAKFKCKDAGSDFTIYSVFAETGWQTSRFSSTSKIKTNMTAKGTGKAGEWVVKDTEWSAYTTPSNKPIAGKNYTFYFGAIDKCNNRSILFDITSSCKF